MTILLILLFSLSLVYISIAERFRTYAALIGFQGLLLFGISFFELKHVDTFNLIFIFAETIIFKTIIVPWLLYRVIDKTKSNKVHKDALPGYYSIILVSIMLVCSYLISFFLEHPVVDKVYFTVSLFALFSGLLLIITHKRIFSHMVGFLVLENAVFLFSLAIGNEMPMLINTGILLDIFISVLILGTFATKIGDTIQSLETDELTHLKD
jgi:hydrogenase-4 component E